MRSHSPDDVLIVVEQLRRKVPGGAGTYAAGLLTGLGRLAGAGEPVPEVTLFASRARRGGPGHGGIQNDLLADTGFPLIESRLPGRLLTRAWSARLAGAPRGFHTLHATSLAVPAARGVRTFVTVHDLAWRHLPFAFPRHGLRWHEDALGEALRRSLDFVVPSQPVANELSEAGADPTRVTVIEPGGDHLPAPDFVGAARRLERNGVTGPFVLSVGTLEPRKNLDVLMEAYSKVRDSLPRPWPLVIVGPDGWGPGLIARLRGGTDRGGD